MKITIETAASGQGLKVSVGDGESHVFDVPNVIVTSCGNRAIVDLLDNRRVVVFQDQAVVTELGETVSEAKARASEKECYHCHKDPCFKGYSHCRKCIIKFAEIYRNGTDIKMVRHSLDLLCEIGPEGVPPALVRALAERAIRLSGPPFPPFKPMAKRPQRGQNPFPRPGAHQIGFKDRSWRPPSC